MQELGIEVPDGGQFDAAGFAEMVKAAREAGTTPIVAGVGDRGFPGAYLAHEMILKKLGIEDYQKLLDGELAWQDERVVSVLEYIQSLVEAGAYPTSFATLKLGESHGYFHTNPGELTFPMGSWYTSRAFLPTDQGGQPADFDLGIMRVPAPDDAACAECKTLAIGGSFVVNANTEHPDLAVALLNEMATVEMGNLWLSSTQVGTGVKTDPSKIDSEYQSYFEDLAEVNEGAEYFIGIPQDHLTGACSETFPAGHQCRFARRPRRCAAGRADDGPGLPEIEPRPRAEGHCPSVPAFSQVHRQEQHHDRWGHQGCAAPPAPAHRRSDPRPRS
jgi:multiple sugar transport system substrate-binding protein